MEFSKVATDTGKQVFEAVEYILSLNIAPADKTNRIFTLIKTVGADFFNKMFNDNSQLFDSLAISSNGFVGFDEQIGQLSTKIVRNHALGREVQPLVKDFYDSALGKAQKEAFDNANSLGKHPTLTRKLNGETCEWCRAKQGTYTDPTSEDFARHHDCDCIFRVSGYNSRNGLLNNYVKKKG